MRQAGRYMAEYRALRARYSLLEIVKSGELAPPLLTYAAEYLGKVEDESLADGIVESLLHLTENPSALVREGAIYGLEEYTDIPDVLERLKQLSEADPSPGVKEAASETLEN
jgi:HEAT repeat protein